MVVTASNQNEAILLDNFIKIIASSKAKLISKGFVYTSDPVCKYTSIQIGLEE